MIEQLEKQNRLQALQMEQLNQKLAEYVHNHGTFPSSSGAFENEDDA